MSLAFCEHFTVPCIPERDKRLRSARADRDPVCILGRLGVGSVHSAGRVQIVSAPCEGEAIKESLRCEGWCPSAMIVSPSSMATASAK
jgi:hypothetical protein